MTAVAGQLPDNFLGEGQHTRLVDGGFGLLAVEENLVGVGLAEASNDLAGPEGIILALGKDDLSYLILHRLHNFISFIPPTIKSRLLCGAVIRRE